MLNIRDLQASAGPRQILKGINLAVNAGEVHAIMGPNGSGKSTLAGVLAGRDGLEVTAGAVRFKDQDLLSLEPEERAREGLFLAFQYPVEIPGVGSTTFFKTADNSIRKHRGEKEIDAMEFLKIIREKREALGISEEMMRRALNVGFSGGEKKRNEVLQMALLEPYLAVLDETDSGLDIDALRIAADGINSLRSPERTMIVITHYQRLLEYVVPDYVHVMADGKVVRSGGKELAIELEEKGYSGVGDKAEAAA